jgi:hypothetical protein
MVSGRIRWKSIASGKSTGQTHPLRKHKAANPVPVCTTQADGFQDRKAMLVNQRVSQHYTAQDGIDLDSAHQFWLQASGTNQF